MKKFVYNVFFAIFVLATVFTGAAFADQECTGWTYYDSGLDSCVSCENQGFTITTTNLAANTTFWFSMSAKGDFTVDWGDKIDHISRSDTTATQYSYTYPTGGVKNIKFCGKATEYNTATGDNVVAAISFYVSNTSPLIKSVSGSMGSVFPTIGNGANPEQQPRFRSTFQGASNLTTIPATLFNGVSGSAESMFRSTFDKCTKLAAIPYGLFAGATGGAKNMFRSTFYQCKVVTSLPDDLFAGITLAFEDEFRFTFYGMEGLKDTFIPPTTFTGLINAGAPQPATGNMWYQTFDKTDMRRTTCPERTKIFTTGYEGNVADSTWNGFVSCVPSNSCTGATYWDATNEVCVPCPSGYTYDTSDTKDSITLCKIQCAAGTYLANAQDTTCTDAGSGYYAAGGLVSYGSTSSRTKCPYDMPTLNDMTNAGSESQCVVYCSGTDYRNASDNTCVSCPTGYDYDDTDGKTAISDCKILCAGGTYLPIAEASACIEVGDGYYAAAAPVAYGSTSARQQCPNDEMTGIFNASSSSQCIELCTGATYHDSVTNTCKACPLGYNAHTISGKTSASQCQIYCEAGTYIANAGDTICTNAGIGYYASASTVNYGDTSTSARQQCPNGQTTDTQTASSISQCQTSCQGYQYYDSTLGQCTDCPAGYRDNTADGKNSINQCQSHCSAGMYTETFTPLLYIQGNGTNQYIDTEYEVKSTHVNGVAVVETPVTVSGSNGDSGNFFGNIYGPGGFSANWKKVGFGLWLQPIQGTGGKATDSAIFQANQQYTITYDVVVNNPNASNVGKGKATLTVNTNADATKEVGGVKINGAGNTFKLFSNGAATREGDTVSNNNSGDKFFSGRIYSLTLYDNGVLVLNLIPVRRESDGAIGMLDSVHNEFYGNTGLGTFAHGGATGDSFSQCVLVGNRHYAGENYTNYGSSTTPNQCPNNAKTIDSNNNIIHNADSIYQCEGIDTCEGAKYPNPTTGVCTNCPIGYMDDTANGKESINQCKIHCDAGTYLAAANDTMCTNVGDGYYAIATYVNYGDAGTRTRCPNAGPTNKENASSDAECIAVAACTGATYMNSGSCTPCPTGYNANTTDGKNSASDCQIACPAGAYLATANAATCTDAGVGFWATGGTVNYGSTSTRTQCASGLTTVGYGHGADELADCGRKLHIGNYIIYAKSAKPTTPAINIRPANDSTYYVAVSNTNHTLTPLHVTQGESQYTAFDDSILYGERDFTTNTRITQ